MAHYTCLVILPEKQKNPTAELISKILTKFSRHYDYFSIGGYWDGELNSDFAYSKAPWWKRIFQGDKTLIARNSCLLKNLPTEIRAPYSVILPSRKWLSEDQFADEEYNPLEVQTSEKWQNKFDKIKAEYANYLCVMLDLHL